MPAPNIDRANLVRCIGCNAWVTPDQRLRAAFVGGHNVRFYVCKACIAAYQAPARCALCDVVLTPENGKLQNEGGRLKLKAYCRKCHHAYDVLRYRQKQQSKLSQKLKNIVR